MQALFESGRIADIVIGVMIIEAVVLILIVKQPAMPTIATLLPGAFMMLALRAAITNSGWQLVALWITLSLPAHIYDVWLRAK